MYSSMDTKVLTRIYLYSTLHIPNENGPPVFEPLTSHYQRDVTPMANSILSANVNSQNVGNALRIMRHECRLNSNEVNAFNKAGLQLEASPWQYNSEMLVLSSRTNAKARYTITYSGCDCRAGQHGRRCWHMAAFLLIQRAAQLALTPAKPKLTDAQYAAAVAAVDELF